MISRFLADNSSTQSALPTLMDAALKGAVLVLIAAGVAYLLRKHSASSRHALWTAAVIGHLAIPALVLILPAWKMPLLPPAPWIPSAPASSAFTAFDIAPGGSGDGSTSAQAAGSGAVKDGNPVAPSPRTVASELKNADGSAPSAPANTPEVRNASGSAPSLSTTAKGRPGIIPVLAMIWFFGALLVLLRLAIGTWRVGQLAREGARVEDGVWLALAQRLANRLGVTRPLILLRGERLAVPVTWGIVYPAVLLPQDSDTWTEERRRFVLVHEMAHVKRFDALTQLLAQISLAVFWFDPLVWLAAHQMRVEREHACDDYVLRDGTTPSLYAGELLEMVRSIGSPKHDRAAPAFAALAMARRSEFEGRMLAILDPRLDRQTLNRRSTLVTAIIVALLTIPLAALRPFQQPTGPVASTAPALPTSETSATSPVTPASKATSSQQPASKASAASTWSCESYPVGTVLHGTSTHISAHNDGNSQMLEFLVNEPGRCTEAALVGKAVFSADETHITQLSPGGFARFRERTSTFDRAVSVTPVGDGSLSYVAMVDGRSAPFDGAMQTWLGQLLPQVLREAAINVPARVARLRAQGGVPAVLQEINQIHSSSAKRAHYEELIKRGPVLSDADAEKVAQQAARDLTSSGDLSSVLKLLPQTAVRSPGTRKAIGDALAHIASSGDRASTLQVLAPNADPEMLIMLAKAAAVLPSSGDKANFLTATAAEYLSNGSGSLRDAYFDAVETIGSSGDMANVLMSAIPYGHASAAIPLKVVEATRSMRSSGDVANVLISLASQRVLQSGGSRATLALIDRTLTMESSGDRANVLVTLASTGALSNAQVKDAYIKAALTLPSEGDRANALAAAARQ